MGSMNLVAVQRQTQALAPRLQHAVRLLQMSSAEFAAVLSQSLASNPFLEAEEVADEAEFEPSPDAALDARDAADSSSEEEDRLTVDRLMDGAPDPDEVLDTAFESDAADERLPGEASDRDLWLADGVFSSGSGSGAGEDGEAGSLIDRTASGLPLNAHLHAQLGLTPLNNRLALLARAIVESLDDDG